MNTSTQCGRVLKRKQIIKGPFIETKTYKWTINDENGQQNFRLNEDSLSVFTEAYNRCLRKKKNISKYVKLNNRENHIFCVEIDNKNNPFLVNINTRSILKV